MSFPQLRSRPFFFFPAAAASGAITGTADMVFGAGTSALTGAGALAGTAANVFGAGSSTLTATGALAGSAALAFGGTNTLTGTGALAGSSANTITPTGTLTGAGALAGTAANVLGGTGTLAGTGALAGSAAITITPTGSIVQGAISGAADITITPVGTLTGAGALAGVAAIVFGGTATPGGGAPVTGPTPAGSSKRRRRERYVVKHGDRYEVFSTPEEMQAYVEAAQAVEAPRPKKQRRPIRIELAPAFAEEIASVTVAPKFNDKAPPSVALEQVRRLEKRLVELARQRDEEDEDDEVLLWLM